jgi:hypothetical protein
MTFDYDVAFSFVKEDEGLATQINDSLQDRYKTFLYSKAQEQLAGTDGEKTFNAVFGEKARTVAVLLRSGWGQTPWTRIEETAIKNRAYNEGYDFSTFIVVVPGTPIPGWLPRTTIWYDLERFGVDGAAAVLQVRIQDRGGTQSEETVEQRAERLQRFENFKNEKRSFQVSEKGVKASQDAYRKLVNDLKANVETLPLGLRVQDVPYTGSTLVIGQGVVLAVEYSCRHLNTLDGSALTANFYDGVPRLPGLYVSEDPRRLMNWKFTFQLLGPGRSGWVRSDKKEYSIDGIAEALLRQFMDLQQGIQAKITK